MVVSGKSDHVRRTDEAFQFSEHGSRIRAGEMHIKHENVRSMETDKLQQVLASHCIARQYAEACVSGELLLHVFTQDIGSCQ